MRARKKADVPAQSSLRPWQKTVRPGIVFAHSANYLRRSSDIIRSDVALCSDVSDLDMDALIPVGSALRIAHRSTGPVFFRVDYLDSGAERFRRLGYWIYSEDFYNELARLALDHQGRVQKVHGGNGGFTQERALRLTAEIYRCLGGYRVRHTPHTLDKILRILLQLCQSGGEFDRFTVGCAVKPTFPLFGKVFRDKQKFMEKSQAVPPPEKLRASNIAR